jgi:hypothetical protein
MKIRINLEHLHLLDERFLLISKLPRKKKKKLKKELAHLLLYIAHQEANRLFFNRVQDAYKDLIKELEDVDSQLSSIHENHS